MQISTTTVTTWPTHLPNALSAQTLDTTSATANTANVKVSTQTEDKRTTVSGSGTTTVKLPASGPLISSIVLSDTTTIFGTSETWVETTTVTDPIFGEQSAVTAIEKITSQTFAGGHEGLTTTRPGGVVVKLPPSTLTTKTRTWTKTVGESG